LTTALEIFRRLIDDPDYQATGDKSREEVVWDEAKQRERQSKNNIRALSLAWTDSPSMKSFIAYLKKADDDDDLDPVLRPVKRKLPEVLPTQEEPTVIDPVGAGRYKSETPLTKLSDALRLHLAADEGLPITGRNPIGSLKTLAGPHIEAIGWLASEDKIKVKPNMNLVAKRKELQVQYTPEDQIDLENLSGAYNNEIFSRMINQYSDIEQDYREISEMLRGSKPYPLEHSKYTKDVKDFVPTAGFHRGNYLSQKYDQLHAARLPLLEDILAYMPTYSELPEPDGTDGYLAMLPPHMQADGMYGKQWVPSKTMGGGTRNLDNFPFGDADAVQKQVDRKLITQEEADGLINLEQHNDIALAQHLSNFGPNIPLNGYVLWFSL